MIILKFEGASWFQIYRDRDFYCFTGEACCDAPTKMGNEHPVAVLSLRNKYKF